MRTSNNWGQYLKALLVSLFLILLLETMARVGKTLRDDLKEHTSTSSRWYVYSTDLGWDRRPRFRGTVVRSRREFDSHGFNRADTDQISNKQKRTIIVLGDSNTFGMLLPTESTFVELLDNLLPNAQVINLGVPGYTSYQGYRTLLKYGLELDPSLIIVSFNYNDRRYVIREEDVDSESRFSKTARIEGIRKIARKIYLYRLMSFLFQPTEEFPKAVDISTLHARVPPDSYRRNLIRIAETANKRRIPVLFMLLKDNPLYTENLMAGIKLMDEQQYNLAMRRLKVAVSLRNEFSTIARIYLAKAYEKQGLLEEAKNVLVVPTPFLSLHGGHPVYLDVEYNEIMRSVARKYNIEVVDGGYILDKDPTVYVDFCHFDENGHLKIAQLLEETIRKMWLKK